MKHDRQGYADIQTIPDKNDCSVRAVAAAGRLPYEEVHELFARFGRKARHKTKSWISGKVIHSLFPAAKYKRVDGVALTRFVEEHDKGHYVVCTSGHMFAVCDGLVVDWYPKPRRRVKYCWKLCN